MKKFNLAKISLAVAASLMAGQAFAGTEACFEVYKVAADGVVTAHQTRYTPASCEGLRLGATDTGLAAIVSPTVAWELTGNVDLDLEALGVTPRTHIVYIPTSDVAPASRIKMQLSGADFGVGNADQIYLVSIDSDGKYQTVASSDGALNNKDTVEFLTKANIIGAGTRLLLSSKLPAEGALEDGALVAGIHLHIANSETCDIDPKVTIKAISALSDAGQTILGAQSSVNGAVAIVDISEQFSIVANSDETRLIQVDAEDPSFRTEFVNNGQSGGTWTNKVIENQAFWETTFVNNYALDMAVDITAGDKITLAVSSTSDTGEGVTLSVVNDKVEVANVSILDATATDHLNAASTITYVDLDNSADEVAITTSPISYTIDADEVFPLDAVTTNNAVVALTNATDSVMEFNYDINTTWGMTFDNDDYLGKNGCEVKTNYEVGVNGAVLKVPYTYKTAANWVRITSEHNTEATIFLDIFDESSHVTKNVELGKIAGKSSVVYKADWMIAQAEAAGYLGTGNRHTMTFTVTAPKNKVHGVSVQAIPGGVDRVMPVLDQNDWSQ